MPDLETIALWALALVMLAVGALHFVRPKPFVRIVPKYLPAPLALLYIGGAFEILGGLGLFVYRVGVASCLVASTKRSQVWAD